MTSNGAKEYELCICMLILFQYLLLLVAFDTLDHKIHLECLFLFLFLYLANSIYQCQLNSWASSLFTHTHTPYDHYGVPQDPILSTVHYL